MKPKLYRALGLMSGTSIDGIDAALIETDGADHIRPLAFSANPYDGAFRDRLRQHLGNAKGNADPAVAVFERELTERHAAIAHDLIGSSGIIPDLIGFHGQTLYHRPSERRTVQIGDGALLARLTGVRCVNDFRSADVQAGGNGAPLVPLFHRALAAGLRRPTLILNIGGVSNVTWVGGPAVAVAPLGAEQSQIDYKDEEILAFDVGPGNAPIDDWILQHTGQSYDESGLLAAAGTVDDSAVAKALEMPFFKQKPPKSLDRDAFRHYIPRHLNGPDGAATLTMIAARGVAAALPFLPQQPLSIYVTGGGRLNVTLMRWIGDVTGLEILPVDVLGWSGDGLEAEAFAWLAVRSLLGLPLSLPQTTGVPKPMKGGTLWPVTA